MVRKYALLVSTLLLALGASQSHAAPASGTQTQTSGTQSKDAGFNPGTRFTNRGSIANTRHNLTQSTASGDIAVFMDGARSDYGEVCVYCHTPHGANANVTLPLWNRTIKATTYTTYDQLGTTSITQTFSQPGAASLSCLSCHDGQTAIDAIVNMPGSGKYDPKAHTTQDNTFLNTWSQNGRATASKHMKLSNDAPAEESCRRCHKPGDDEIGVAPDFTIFAIGTDLRNDHPVGVTFPSQNGSGTDWNTPAGQQGKSRYFDSNKNGKMDSPDIRLYDTNGRAQVECASCHDPHGVPTAGPGSVFAPTFLRVSNTGSAVCLTCHAK